MSSMIASRAFLASSVSKLKSERPFSSKDGVGRLRACRYDSTMAVLCWVRDASWEIRVGAI